MTHRRVLALAAAVAVLPALLVTAPASAAPAPDVAPAVSVSPVNVQGMIKKSVDYAAGHENKWLKAGKLPAGTALEKAFTYEADGYGKGYVGVTGPAGVTTWRVLVGLQFKLPDGMRAFDTVVFTWKNGTRSKIKYYPQPTLEDLFFTYTKHDFTWAWDLMQQWQLTESSFPAFIPPTTFNVRNPLVIPMKKNPSWIFGITQVDGSRAFIFVNDKTGKVSFEQETEIGNSWGV